MRVRLIMLSLLVITAVNIWAIEDHQRMSLVREPRPARTFFGMTQVRYTGENAGTPYWKVRIGGKELRFELPAREMVEMESWMSVKIDGLEQGQLRGGVVFGGFHMKAVMIEYEPFPCRLNESELTLTVKLVKTESTEWEKGTFPWAPTVSNESGSSSFKSWVLLLGNAQTFGGPLEHKRRKGHIWLIDANLDGDYDQRLGDCYLWLSVSTDVFQDKDLDADWGTLAPVIKFDRWDYRVDLQLEGEDRLTLILTKIGFNPF